MAWKRGPRRTTKPKDADTRAKLLITLRNREKVWVVGETETIVKLRREIHEATQNNVGLWDLFPHAETSVLLTQIDVLQYFPPKIATTAPEATPS